VAAPAFAQSETTTSETTRTVTAPVAPPPPPPMMAPVPIVPQEQSGSSYEQHSVTHSVDGPNRVDSRSDKYIGPDGSSSSSSKTIEQEVR